jgi:adenylate cyclase
MRKLHSFLIVLFLFAVKAKAQTNLDSLYTIWQDQNQPDSTRVKAYSDYIWDGFLFSHPDTAEILAEDLHIFAKQHHYPKASTTGYSLQSTANSVQGNYPRALDYSHKSLAIDEVIGDKIGIAGKLNNIGIIYKEQGNYPRSLEYSQKSLAIYEEIGDKEGISMCLNNIGIIYDIQDNYPLALEYYHKSLAIDEELGDKQGIAYALHNIGSIYHGQGNYPQALDYYQKSLEVQEEIGNKIGISTILNNIGVIYKKQGNYPRALDYQQKSLAISEEIGNNLGISTSLNCIGNIYNDQGNYLKALSYCQKGLTLAKDIGSLGEQKHACQCLYETYKARGMGNEALVYHEQMIMLRDSMFNKENTKKLTRLEMQYEFEKKEAATQAEQDKKDAIAAQQIQRQKLVRNGFMGGFAVVLLFAVVFLVQRNRIGKEKQRSEELLLNILPEEVADELKAKGTADAKQYEQVTVIFTDFKGFTAMSEKLSPKELVDDLNVCFSEFDKIITKHSIEKIKTIGDAYMAAGGLPTINNTHSKDVINAAFKMRDFIEAGKAQKIAAGLPYFEIRIGIHTGPLVAGIVGVKKFQYDIWGDTVNTASRMESSGEVGRVNVSETTYKLLKDDVSLRFTFRGKVEAKGKGEMEMYFVDRNS